MSSGQTHRLEGLEPDNLLAFLALLGLLRALEGNGLRPRVRWEGVPTRPVLVLPERLARADVAAAAAHGCALLAFDHEFDGEKNLTFDGEHARALMGAAITPGSRGRAALLGALFSDAALNTDGKPEKVRASPLCMIFGQGHQDFLSRLADVPLMTGGNRKGASRVLAPDLNDPARLEAALFAPWKRDDPTDGFRWDPAEDRRYALRATKPSDDPARTEHGANRLAALGLAALPGAAVRRRGGTRFLTLGAEYGDGKGIEITWPIWAPALSLVAIQALMAHPDLVSGDGSALRRLGVTERRRTRRISVGKYFNVTRADCV